MAWVTKSERFNWHKEEDLVAACRAPSPSPGQYAVPTSFKEESKSRPCYAPFNSSSAEVQGGISGKKDDALGLDPARYNPKQPGAYDHGLPKKHVPFTQGAARWSSELKQDFRPGPGDYAPVRQTLAGSLSVAASKTMGVPPAEQKLIFKSTSAPSIPRDHQCYGYDEAGDGRLIRQGRKDGIQQLSGKPGDSAGPGQYDAHKFRVVANTAAGGKIMPPTAEPIMKISETPGPGHYVAKGVAQSEKVPLVYSAFASQSQRGRTKQENKYDAEMPGPGQYMPRMQKRPNMRELHPELQYFGSTEQRFKEDEAAVVASKLPGPGTYGIPDSKNRGKSFAWLKGKRFKEPSQQEMRPGPGAYYDAKSGWRHGSTSILGSNGSLAFGSMEARRGVSDPKKGQEPGPGAYYDGVEEASSVGGNTGTHGSRKPRRIFPPSSFFRSTVPKDVMVAQYQKDGQVGPPPGAYSPRLSRDLGSIQRLAPKGEGFGSGAERLQSEALPMCGPGPGWYKVQDVTGGKIQGTFNRHAVDAAPASGKPRGLGFDSQSKRFGLGDPNGEVLPGPGTYNTRKDSDWITLTHNIYFGDFA